MKTFEALKCRMIWMQSPLLDKEVCCSYHMTLADSFKLFFLKFPPKVELPHLELP